MKTSAATVKHPPSAWRDVQRDWEGWSAGERNFVRFLTFASMASAAFWFAMSFNLIH